MPQKWIHIVDGLHVYNKCWVINKLNKESQIFLHVHMANQKIKQQLGCFVIHKKSKWR